MSVEVAGNPLQRIALLGATGSIGDSTLDVIRLHPDRYQAWVMTAHSQVQKAFVQCQQFQPTYFVMVNPQAAQELSQLLKSIHSKTEVLSGDSALVDIVAASEVDIVVLGIVGAAGLAPGLAAVRARKRVLLANKEALVMAGALFMAEVRRHQTELLPLDSEHNAIFQCLPLNCQTVWQTPNLIEQGLSRIILTASGGPFLKTSAAELSHITPEQACAHPNWQMGKKISVDSATLMNKGLEFIEACYLFDIPPSAVEVLIHPQSIVHSMVEWRDGSVLAQLSQPDMKIPIAYGLAWPARIKTQVPQLDWRQITQLEFCLPDTQRFPCLQLAIDAMKTGGSAPVVLNAANEVAVAHFLAGKIAFIEIAKVIIKTLEKMPSVPLSDLAAVWDIDQESRALTSEFICS